MPRNFDAIVIGSGLGGLTAGALCARSGLRVLALERNDSFGGAATVYRHNGLAIETSLHEIDGFDEDDPKLPLIQALGLDRDLQLVDVGDLYEVRGGPLDKPFVLAHGAETALTAAIARFPQHKAALEEYFRRLLALRGAASLAERFLSQGGAARSLERKPQCDYLAHNKEQGTTDGAHARILPRTGHNRGHARWPTAPRAQPEAPGQRLARATSRLEGTALVPALCLKSLRAGLRS